MSIGGFEHPGVKPSAKDFDDGYGGGDLIRRDPDFPADDGAGIIRLLHIVLVYHAHFMGQKVPLLECAACSLPFSRRKAVSKIESKHLLHAPPRA
jgi:hypothetical protein